MTVTVDAPPNPPRLTGDYARDMEAWHRWAVGMTRALTQVRERTGGSTDLVADTADTANTASTTADASQAGAVVPTSGGSVELSPANPLSYTLVDVDTATIAVAGHTRTGAGAALTAANVSPDVSRGATYYVYYADAGNAGGAQTFLASTSLSTVTGTAGYRIIGTIFVPLAAYSERVVSGGVLP